MEKLIIDMLSSGCLSFLFSKMAKAMNQKEISEIISMAGWSIIGVDMLNIVIPLAKTLTGSVEKTVHSFESIAKFFEGIANFVTK